MAIIPTTIEEYKRQEEEVFGVPYEELPEDLKLSDELIQLILNDNE